MARKFYSEDAEGGNAIKYVETQPAGFTKITSSDELINLHKRLYAQRKLDGHDYENEYMAKIYLKIIDGTHTPAEVFLLESHVSTLMHDVEVGSWMTAQSTNLNLPLEGIYDQAMKDDIQAYLDTYVSENY